MDSNSSIRRATDEDTSIEWGCRNTVDRTEMRLVLLDVLGGKWWIDHMERRLSTKDVICIHLPHSHSTWSLQHKFVNLLFDCLKILNHLVLASLPLGDISHE